MTVHAGRDGRVDCRAAIPLDLPAAAAWGQVRDFARYASHDYFHADLRVDGGVPRQGAALRLTHRHAGVRVERVGRICWWEEGVGWAFSDLSRRGPRHGFPHVLVVRVEAAGTGVGGASRCVLHVAVRGRWTAAWVPPALRRLWLAWVFAYVVSRTRNDLWAYQAARQHAKGNGACITDERR
jgi:hypothetical protein